jgi:hypothetical protein
LIAATPQKEKFFKKEKFGSRYAPQSTIAAVNTLYVLAIATVFLIWHNENSERYAAAEIAEVASLN